METLTQQDFRRILNFVQGLYSVDRLQNFSAYISTTISKLVQAETERDRIVLNLLLPHFMQSRQTEQIFAQLQQENKQLRDSLTATGSIIISDNGDVLFMTSKAEKWLQHYFFNDAKQSLPDHLQQWVKYQKSLHHGNSSMPKPHLPMKIEQDGKQLVIRFVADPSSNQYVLVLEEQSFTSLTIEALEYLGLSKREAEVLFWVAKGKENPEIAKVLCVSTVTVRKHLEHTYQKLHVKTRSAAVITALQKLGILTCE